MLGYTFIMMFKRNIRAVLLASFFLPWASPGVLADSDHIEARRLQESGEILPLSSLLETARQSHPGTVLEVELEKEQDLVIYEIEILGEDGVVREIRINARTGELLDQKKDH